MVLLLVLGVYELAGEVMGWAAKEKIYPTFKPRPLSNMTDRHLAVACVYLVPQ
jgi:hypothetical protein